jgi:hypothetical protein
MQLVSSRGLAAPSRAEATLPEGGPRAGKSMGRQALLPRTSALAQSPSNLRTHWAIDPELR